MYMTVGWKIPEQPIEEMKVQRTVANWVSLCCHSQRRRIVILDLGSIVNRERCSESERMSERKSAVKGTRSACYPPAG